MASSLVKRLATSAVLGLGAAGMAVSSGCGTAGVIFPHGNPNAIRAADALGQNAWNAYSAENAARAGRSEVNIYNNGNQKGNQTNISHEPSLYKVGAYNKWIDLNGDGMFESDFTECVGLKNRFSVDENISFAVVVDNAIGKNIVFKLFNSKGDIVKESVFDKSPFNLVSSTSNYYSPKFSPGSYIGAYYIDGKNIASIPIEIVKD